MISYLIRLSNGHSLGPFKKAEFISECLNNNDVDDTCWVCKYIGGFCYSSYPVKNECSSVQMIKAIHTHSEFNKKKRLLDEAHKTYSDLRKNPKPEAICYIYRNNTQEGPYTALQIKSMWDSGIVSADTQYYYSELKEWCPVAEFCQNPNWRGIKENSANINALVNQQKETNTLLYAISLGLGLMGLGYLIVRSFPALK